MTITTKDINIFIHTVHLSALKLTATTNVSNLELFKTQLNEYSERALLLSKNNDYIVLNHCPNEDYLAYLTNLGIGTHNILIPTAAGESLSDRILKDKQLLKFLRELGEAKLTIQPYISTPIEAQIAKLINATINGSPSDLTTQINSKIYLPTLLQELALPTIEHEIADATTVVNTAKKLIDKYAKIVIIGEHTYGGIAVWKLTNAQTFNAFEHKISKCQPTDRFLVEKMYEVLCSPNIQYDIRADYIQELGITEQILDTKLQHHGNMYPLPACQLTEINHYAKIISAKLQAKGYRGLVGIDFIETVEGKIFAVDINGRANASSFGLKAMHSLFPDSYQQKHFKILTNLNLGKELTFAELRNILGENNIFTKQTGQGILPYNVGFLKWGKFSAIIVADTPEDVDRWYNMLNDGLF